MDKNHCLQLLHTALYLHCPLIFLKVRGRRKLSSALGVRHFPCTNPAEERYFPSSIYRPHQAIFSTAGSGYCTPHSCLISCSHSIRKHPPTRFKTQQLVCVRTVNILNQKRPLRPSAPTLFGHRVLLISSRNLDLAKQGRDPPQPAESERWTSLGLPSHGLLNLQEVPVLHIWGFNL